MAEDSSKINGIILLRAIAALGVCLLHIQLATGYHGNAFLDYLIANGQQGVPIFFVISGFVLPYSLFKKSYRIHDFFSFILKRSVRVDLPYWACIFLLFAFALLPLSYLNFTNLLLHITYLVPFVKHARWYSEIFWTLSIEFQFYIILGLSYPIFNKIPVLVSVTILILLSAFCTDYTKRGIIISNVFQFTFGYIAFLSYTKLLKREWFWVSFSIFTVYIIFAKSIISGLVPALTVLFILFYTSGRRIPVFNFLGTISYSLYLMHVPASLLTIRLLKPWIRHSGPMSLACLCSSIVLASIFYWMIERPSLRLSKTILTKYFISFPVLAKSKADLAKSAGLK